VVEDLKILESEGSVEDQLEVLGGPTNLGGGLGGGGVHILIVSDVVHYGDKSTRFSGGIKDFPQLFSKKFWVDLIPKMINNSI